MKGFYDKPRESWMPPLSDDEIVIKTIAGRMQKWECGCWVGEGKGGFCKVHTKQILEKRKKDGRGRNKRKN